MIAVNWLITSCSTGKVLSVINTCIIEMLYEANINFRPVAHLLAKLHNIDVEKFCSSDERPSFEIVKTIKSWLKFIAKFYCDEEEKFRCFNFILLL